MKKILFVILIIASQLPVVAHEFVVCKKSKTKKETSGQVKEDILELLDFFTVRPFPLRPTEMNDAFKFNQCFESPARLNCFKT